MILAIFFIEKNVVLAGQLRHNDPDTGFADTADGPVIQQDPQHDRGGVL